LNQSQGIIDDEADIEDAQLDASRQPFASLYAEDYDTTEYGLLPPENAVIIRPYGGEDDDILLQELRPRFVVMYEPNLPFIRRLEVYKNCNPGLALRVYQMTYTNSFEEDRFLASMQREAEAFKKLIEDRSVSGSTCIIAEVRLMAGHGHSDLQQQPPCPDAGSRTAVKDHLFVEKRGRSGRRRAVQGAQNSVAASQAGWES
jgi:hypothetical protein